VAPQRRAQIKRAAAEGSYSSTGDRIFKVEMEAQQRANALQQYQKGLRLQVIQGRLPAKSKVVQNRNHSSSSSSSSLVS
jgi:hypothetical protein